MSAIWKDWTKTRSILLVVAGLAVDATIGAKIYSWVTSDSTQTADAFPKGDKQGVTYAAPFLPTTIVPAAIPKKPDVDFKPAAAATTYAHEAIIRKHTVIRETPSPSGKPVATMEKGIHITVTGGEKNHWVPVEVTDADKQKYIGYIPSGIHQFTYIN